MAWITARFPKLAAAVGKLRPTRLVLDGEAAVFDEQLVSQFSCCTTLSPRSSAPRRSSWPSTASGSGTGIFNPN